MGNYTKIEVNDIEQLYYKSGLVKEKKLHAVKKGIFVEKNGNKIWAETIDVCDLKGNLILQIRDGYLDPTSYVLYRKSYIICYKHFFVVCAKEIVGSDGMGKILRDAYDVFTYKGRQLDINHKLWKRDKDKIKYYNTMAQLYDKGMSK